MYDRKIFNWPIFFIVILSYVFMLSLFLWVSNISHLKVFLLTIPFLLMTCVYIVLFIKNR
ncbi:hypothetical protein BU036_08245 [Staphylococcus simulans]|nr:hypothetical protein BU053_11315 [Staphylococcus simulans]PTI95860.1 hypothetical protein BU054_12750 [Staphylococcus simulans]PTJ01218.1 hypothetical protein BU047_11460 [Staphylococcus simulans]PTJ09015.1 hypothetical protein BU044_11655 [Staphylococcus simulans]PTJ14282.1 hypothetical protein BU038_10690 [Staphylococcus simulans]